MIESTRIPGKSTFAWVIRAFLALAIAVLCSSLLSISAYAGEIASTSAGSLLVLGEKADEPNGSTPALPGNRQDRGEQTEGAIAGVNVSNTQSQASPKQTPSSDNAASPELGKATSSEKAASSSASVESSSQIVAPTQQKPTVKPTKAGWIKDSDGTWYYFANPKAKPSTGWINSGGVWYWLQPEANGAMAKSQWITANGNKYYLRDTGHLATGWIKDAGQWYYANASGAKVKSGWVCPGGVWYWLQGDKDGAMAASTWITDGSKREFYLTASGAMATGWIKDAGQWYYANASGAKVKSGWVCPGGVWYWLQGDKDGAMAASTWITDGSKREFYLTASGAMATGWIKDAGQWYYAGPTGAKVGGGWISLGGTWYWLDSANKGAMVANVIKRIGGKDYSFTSSGSMRAHCQVNLGNNIAGYAADSGAISRIGKFENGKLVLTDDSGKIVSGWRKVAGLWFYGASKTGVAQIGWLNLGGVWYYLDSSGAMVTGNRTIDGKVNVFDGSGRWLGASVYATRAQGYSSGTNRLILVDRGNHKVVVFNGRQENWNLEHEWSCVTGAPGTPTITGTFRTTGYKMGTLTTDGRAHYCTQIAGGYFFHTILASDSELGQSLSHGCIRLSYPNAQWIYNNIGAGTTVAIYN